MIKMKKLGTNLKKAREFLGLTQDDVARLMGVSRLIITNIESGNRKVSAEELFKFSKIYGISMEDLCAEDTIDDNIKIFARSISDLDDNDRKEILNLIKLKKMYKENKLND